MSPFWQLINRPAEARRKFTFTLRRRIDLVTMITADLVKSCSLPSIRRRLASPYLAPVRVAVLPHHRRRKE
jgi:hypothetical protein